MEQLFCRTSLWGCVWGYNYSFQITLKSTTWSHLNQLNPVSKIITRCYCRENIRCYGWECENLTINVHIREDLTFKFLNVITITDFGVSTVILNPAEFLVGGTSWTLVFWRISRNNWQGTTLSNPLRYWLDLLLPLLPRLDLDLDNSFWIQKILYFWHLATLTFAFPHNIWCREIELDCIWTILLDIINYTEEWGKILDVLLVYVTMTCDTQSCIKSTVMWMEISSCTNYQMMEL